MGQELESTPLFRQASMADVEAAALLEPTPAFSLTGFLSPVILVPLSFAPVAAALAPLDVLDRSPALKAFVEFVHRLSPYLRAHADSTRFVQVDLLVTALVIAVVPVVAFLTHIFCILNYRRMLAHRLHAPFEVGRHLLIMLAAVLFPFIVVVALMLPGDPSWSGGTTTVHRSWFYVLSSFVLPFSTGWAFGIQWANLKLLFVTHDARVRRRVEAKMRAFKSRS